MASVIKGLLDRFGRVQMSAARLVSGARKYGLIPLVLHVLAVSGVFKRGLLGYALSVKKKSVLTKEKIGKHGLPHLFIYLNNFSKY